MTPEQLAEIQAADGQFDLKPSAISVYGHRRALLAYVAELKHNLRSAGECLDAYATANARGEAEIERLRRDVIELVEERDRLLSEVSRLTAVVADYENRITWNTTCQQCATVLDRAIADYERADRAEAERDRARQMLRFCFKRWPAPIFWHAAAQIDDPYTALPDWLTGETDTAPQAGAAADAMRARLLAGQVERLSAKWLGNGQAAAMTDDGIGDEES